VLESSTPPDAKLAQHHTGRGPCANTAARAATPTASTASTKAPKPGPAGASETSSANAQRQKCSRIAVARSPKRRNQRRTLHAGTPRRNAIRR
jgi:hypothetical protein